MTHQDAIVRITTSKWQKLSSHDFSFQAARLSVLEEGKDCFSIRSRTLGMVNLYLLAKRLISPFFLLSLERK